MMSDHIINSPDHWRKRAEEARALAVGMTVAKGLMLEIAYDYDELAGLLVRSHHGAYTQSLRA
jgi:hypothetical protein